MRAVTHRIGACALTITILCSLQTSAARAGSSGAAGVAAVKQITLCVGGSARVSGNTP